jgi:2-polyprenyl-3-methyl-5-hydroxy-6-metoxy-1,4-benzoquinol methylase
VKDNNCLNIKDQVGFDTLNNLSKAPRFNKWIFDTIKPFAAGNILEIGSGIGNISDFFIENKYCISLSDIDYYYLEELRTKYAGLSNVTNILQINLESENFENNYQDLKENYDTIFFLNVLEHIEKDDRAIRNSCFLLKPGGKMIILVPSYSFLFSKIDEQLGHFRRYNRKAIVQIMGQHSLRIEKHFYFNALGIIGWLYGKALGLKKIPSKEISFFDKLVWSAKGIDKLLFNKVGLSHIIVAEKRP